ncbi:MAG: type II 3-dehydroquinate dehydratase [Oscillospiraceae bacterium]
MNFLILNGPNLNLLGSREPAIYGREDYPALCKLVTDHAIKNGSAATCLQSNHEGDLVDAIQKAPGVYDAVILNPGAYTHYSYAIYDAIKAVEVPVFEVHISDIQSREDFRKISVTAPACVGQIFGEGLAGYTRAMDYFLQK